MVGINEGRQRVNGDWYRTPQVPEVFTLAAKAWVILDGNYDDFAVGQELEFPLSLYLKTVTVGTRKRPAWGIYHLEDCVYRLAGRIVAIATGGPDDSGTWVAYTGIDRPRAWAIDAGIYVSFEAEYPYLEPDISGADSWKPGDVFVAEADLALPEPQAVIGLCGLPAMPPTVYRWRVEGIDMCGPFGSYQPLERTHAETDGFCSEWAEYLLHCRLLPVPPRWDEIGSDGANLDPEDEGPKDDQRLVNATVDTGHVQRVW